MKPAKAIGRNISTTVDITVCEVFTKRTAAFYRIKMQLLRVLRIALKRHCYSIRRLPIVVKRNMLALAYLGSETVA